MSNYVLPLILVLPVIGAILVAVLPCAELAKKWALFVSLIVAVLGIYLLVAFPYHLGGWQFQLSPQPGSWLRLDSLGVQFRPGIDAIRLFSVGHAILLMP